MSSVDFDKIWFKKLEMTDNLTAFKCDTDDDSGCDEFIHKAEEAKLYQKEKHGITYLFFLRRNNDWLCYISHVKHIRGKARKGH